MTQLIEVEGHPTVPTTTAPTIPAKLVDDFTPTLIDFGEHHLCPGCGEPIAMRSAMGSTGRGDVTRKCGVSIVHHARPGSPSARASNAGSVTAIAAARPTRGCR